MTKAHLLELKQQEIDRFVLENILVFEGWRSLIAQPMFELDAYVKLHFPIFCAYNELTLQRSDLVRQCQEEFAAKWQMQARSNYEETERKKYPEKQKR